MLCQSSSGFYPEFLTEREALALLSSSESEEMPTTHRPSDVTKQSASSSATGDSVTTGAAAAAVVPGSHHDLGQPHEPRHPSSKDSYDFSVRHHLKVDPENQKKFYDTTTGSMDHMKHEEKAANEPKSHHHTDSGHENHQHDHHHHHHEKKEKDHKHHDHHHHHSEKDHKHGHGEHHKHHKDEKNHQEHHHQQNHDQHQQQQHQEDDGKKQGKDIYYRRPQYDEVIEPHQILMEPHLYQQPHVDPDAHNLYYKNAGYDYGAGAGGEVAYRSDFYWLIPLVIIIGIGALLLPMLSLFMTIMVSQGAITLTGRRKRSFMNEESGISAESIMGLISKVESAIKKFNSQKSD